MLEHNGHRRAEMLIHPTLLDPLDSAIATFELHFIRTGCSASTSARRKKVKIEAYGDVRLDCNFMFHNLHNYWVCFSYMQMAKKESHTKHQLDECMARREAKRVFPYLIDKLSLLHVWWWRSEKRMGKKKKAELDLRSRAWRNTTFSAPERHASMRRAIETRWEASWAPLGGHRVDLSRPCKYRKIENQKICLIFISKSIQSGARHQTVWDART